MIDTVSIYGIVSILAGHRASADYLIAAVTNIRGFIKTVTPLSDKVGTMLVADGTGCTLYTAENDLVADIGLPASVTTNAEVVGIVECSLTVQIAHPVKPYLLGDSCWILA